MIHLINVEKRSLWSEPPLRSLTKSNGDLEFPGFRFPRRLPIILLNAWITIWVGSRGSRTVAAIRRHKE